MNNHPEFQPKQYASFPIMTLILVTLNMLVFIAQTMLEEINFDYFLQVVFLFGSVPKLVLDLQGGGALTTITSLFLHGDGFHIASNMIVLWAFGRRVEDVCGPWRFLAFYLLCGVAANIISIMSRSTESIPDIGASGAIYGVMAAYLIVFPRRRIILDLTRIGLIRIPIHAFWIILFFFLKEIPYALDDVLLVNVDGIAHWAHLGGFFAGTLIFLFLRPDAFHRFRNELPI